MSYGPKLVFSDQLHAEKYRLVDEDYRGKCNRVAGALADDDDHFRAYREITLDQRFLEAGRVQSAIGAPKLVTPYNCFVSQTIEDSTEGICDTFSRAFQTMRMGGGIGYDWSTLRPNGDMIVKLDSNSSGPISFMGIFSELCHCIASSGHRRGAQMGVLRIDHPDIEAFIRIKHDLTKLTGFNISIAVTDEFMEAKASGKPFTLRFNGRAYKQVDPNALWEEVMRSTWDYADPGVLFIDTINRMNNLYYCETIAATNPCGEQPLPPNGACLLGSLNLVRYIKQDALGHRYFDWAQYRADIPHIVRAMDNVVDRAIYPLEEQKAEAISKRRMGLGFTGLANAGEALGHLYGSPGFIEFELQLLDELNHHAYMASSLLAAEKGSFPLFDADLFLAGEYAKQLDDEVRASIKKNGLRNSHLTSIAPTGTISFAHDYISSGCEPVFGFEQLDKEGQLLGYSYDGKRKVRMKSGEIITDVSDYGFREFGVEGKMSHEVTIQEHLDVLLAAAARVDSSVSKTINTDGSVPWDTFKGIYDQVWERGGKGCTTFNKDGKKMGILLGTIVDEPDRPDAPKDGATCEINPDGSRDCG
ncbi:ribonucleotide reductase [Roseobacter phage RDJL Phi 2]|uniref:ribonucleoside-diphosphate reductase n=1 Tax=Roseobacter phage RDJL Phi 2 TaxID=1682380 RepID=A0A0K0PVE2_9CAUD|nr:ribonucleotide reductase [Roseobacter phage RDJL Phi 2]AKQ75795.1 ribonucleotide reductase [Roseobacter phage RDJL Phi 2]